MLSKPSGCSRYSSDIDALQRYLAGPLARGQVPLGIFNEDGGRREDAFIAAVQMLSVCGRKAPMWPERSGRLKQGKPNERQVGAFHHSLPSDWP